MLSASKSGCLHVVVFVSIAAVSHIHFLVSKSQTFACMFSLVLLLVELFIGSIMSASTMTQVGAAVPAADVSCPLFFIRSRHLSGLQLDLTLVAAFHLC